MKELNESSPFFGAEKALEVDEGVQLKEDFPPPKHVSTLGPILLNKTLCTCGGYVDGKG